MPEGEKGSMCNFPPAFCSSFYFNLSLLKKKIENKDEAKPVQSFTEREKKKINSIMGHDVKS